MATVDLDDNDPEAALRPLEVETLQPAATAQMTLRERNSEP